MRITQNTCVEFCVYLKFACAETYGWVCKHITKTCTAVLWPAAITLNCFFTGYMTARCIDFAIFVWYNHQENDGYAVYSCAEAALHLAIADLLRLIVFFVRISDHTSEHICEPLWFLSAIARCCFFQNFGGSVRFINRVALGNFAVRHSAFVLK